MTDSNSVGILINKTDKALELGNALISKYNFKEFNRNGNFSKILVVGGDGFMLSCIHEFIDLSLPFYGLNGGTMGFLMNDYNKNIDLIDAINSSEEIITNPLNFEVEDISGQIHKEFAINEISTLRSTHQMVRIKIEIDGVERLDELRGDGVLVSSEIGSGAYNFSANGFILPMNHKLISLVPVSVFRPRGWGGALLDIDSEIKLTVLDETNRKVVVTADYLDFRNIRSVKIKTNKDKIVKVLFNKSMPIKEKILREQFWK